MPLELVISHSKAHTSCYKNDINISALMCVTISNRLHSRQHAKNSNTLNYPAFVSLHTIQLPLVTSHRYLIKIVTIMFPMRLS